MRIQTILLQNNLEHLDLLNQVDRSQCPYGYFLEISDSIIESNFNELLKRELESDEGFIAVAFTDAGVWCLATVKMDLFDQQALGVSCGKMQFFFSTQRNEDELACFSEVLDIVMAYHREKGINLSATKVGEQREYTSRVLKKNGFRFIGNEVVFVHRKLVEGKSFPNLILQNHQCALRNQLPALDIVVEHSRFHVDSRIASESADKYWQCIVNREVCSPKNPYFIYRSGDQLIGLVLCIDNYLPSNSCKIDIVRSFFFVGVQSMFQGRGFGRQMVIECLAATSRVTKFIEVEAYSTNHRAIKLYKDCGFDPVLQRSVYHHGPN